VKFSERIGITPVDTTLQTQGMNDALRNSLWNVLDIYIWSRKGFKYSLYGSDLGDIDLFSRRLWFNYFKKPIDSRSRYPDKILDSIRKYFFDAEWYEAYDFLEYVISFQRTPRLSSAINSILERELAGYRYIEETFVPVTDKQEVEALQKALAEGPFSGVQAHLKQAMEHLSRRKNPDYRNSIKESISAVESMAREVTQNPSATLGDALSELERNAGLHPALKRGFSAIYGYTIDEGGIRHAMLEEPDIGVAEAKFFLVSCATFINYLKSKIGKVT